MYFQTWIASRKNNVPREDTLYKNSSSKHKRTNGPNWGIEISLSWYAKTIVPEQIKLFSLYSENHSRSKFKIRWHWLASDTYRFDSAAFFLIMNRNGSFCEFIRKTKCSLAILGPLTSSRQSFASKSSLCRTRWSKNCF